MLKYRFVTAIEGIVNVAQHLCASEGWGPPASNADAMHVLARHGVLDAELAEVDDGLVVAHLDHVGALDAFVEAVCRWMGG